MSDTRTLLNRISQFRRRLEQMPPLVADVSTNEEANKIVSDADKLSTTLRKLAHVEGRESTPPVLTNRARTLLEDARGLIAKQRQISSETLINTQDQSDPLCQFHRKTVALTDAALRLVHAFPDAADVQLRLCDGVEAMLTVIRDRLEGIKRALTEQKTTAGRVDKLAKLLAAVVSGRAVSLSAFAEVGEMVLDDARQALPLRFLNISPVSAQGLPETEALPPPARFVAGQALTAAAIAARLAPHDFEFAVNPMAPVLASLLMNIGMLRIPASILATQGVLDQNERRQVDLHPRVGAEIIRKYLPEAASIADAIAAHHERPDGTGFPNGLRNDSLPSLSKLLSIADKYAGMCSDRPHRPAYDPRTALTDLLLDAEKGKVDKDFAEYLVHLSFHPVGTVVELTDGRVGVVVSNHGGRMNMKTTSRPVVAVLTDHSGRVMPKPDHVDLSAAERGSVVRTLGSDERKKLLADWYPELCG